ncbi:MAG: hypothetical protein JST83_05440 [Bacteroidetes bacterium]|nr:hypothetical protein [Bacteroidota bacterium]
MIQIVEVDPRDLVFDSSVENVFGAPELSSYADLIQSFHEHGSIGSIPVYRDVEGKKLCFAGRKFVQYAIATGIDRIPAKRLDGDDDQTAIRSILSNRTKHTSELVLAKMALRLYDIFKVGQGTRTDIKEVADEAKGNDFLIDTEAAESVPANSKEKPSKVRNPMVYDKIGQVLGVSAKKALYLRTVYLHSPQYFERIGKERQSLYEAYSKVTSDKRGDVQSIPQEKPAIIVTNDTGLPVFSEPSTTYDANFVYDIVHSEKFTPAQTKDGKKHVAYQVIYVSQKFTCCNCATENEIRVPKMPENDE